MFAILQWRLFCVFRLYSKELRNSGRAAIMYAVKEMQVRLCSQYLNDVT